MAPVTPIKPVAADTTTTGAATENAAVDIAAPPKIIVEPLVSGLATASLEPQPKPTGTGAIRRSRVVRARSELPASAADGKVMVTKEPAGEEPEPAISEVKPAVFQEAVSRVSNKASRAKMRNSVMQVSNEVLDPFKDPFEDTPISNKTGDLEAQDSTAEAPTAGTTPGDGPSPTRPEPEGFGNEPAPLPPQGDFLPGETMPLPATEPVPEVTVGPEGCENDASDCMRAVNDLQRRDIKTVMVRLSVSGVEGNDYPCECSLGTEVYQRRAFSPTTFTWKATGVCHRPLYFEDVQLERYGHSWNPVVQPFMSAAHFFISIPLLPYKMGLNPPNECIYTLGYYRPEQFVPLM